MKTSFVILLGLLGVWSDPAEARILQQGKNKNKENKEKKDSENANAVTDLQVLPEKQDNIIVTEKAPNLNKESKEFGYATAQSLWSSTDKGYTCANIAQTFWLDVKETVFAECESQWTSQSSTGNPVGMCRRGAKKFTMDQLDECFNVEDCYRLGIGASTAVARGFCNNSEGLLEREIIPRKCKKLAVMTCASDAVKTIEEFYQSSTCDAIQDSTLNYVDEIRDLCEAEVDEKEANLEM